MSAQKKENIKDVWNNAFRIIELAFNKENIIDGLQAAIKMILKFTKANDIQIYKASKNKHGNIINILENDKTIEELYQHINPKETINKIIIQTKNSFYIVIIEGNQIIEPELNAEYLSVLKRAFTIIFEKLDFEEQLTTDSITDSLTQIGNRNYYNKYIKELSQNPSQDITYSLIDLFRLKYINDTFGHKNGDNYIVTVASLLKDKLDDEDFLFRIGGDEFVTASLGKKKAAIEKKLREVNDALSKENLELNLPFPLSINFGIVEGHIDIEEAYLQADEIMAHHKAKTYKKLNINRRK